MKVIKYKFQQHGDSRGQLVALEEGKEILASIDGAYAIWVDTNNEIFISDGFETMLKSKGASGADK